MNNGIYKKCLIFAVIFLGVFDFTKSSFAANLLKSADFESVNWASDWIDPVAEMGDFTYTLTDYVRVASPRIGSSGSCSIRGGHK
jgi:hypothetical protein